MSTKYWSLCRSPRSQSVNLHNAYTTFEKQYGDREGVEDVIISKRRVQYEEQVKENPKNYDAWFDYARLEESSGDADCHRGTFRWEGASVCKGYRYPVQTRAVCPASTNVSLVVTRSCQPDLCCPEPVTRWKTDEFA